MAANSKIQWCDHTFNPWSGCTKISPGCANCYAAVDYSVKMRGVKWGPSGNRIVKAESGWKEPLKWDRAAKEACERHRVFCASLADVFEDWTGIMLDAESVQLWKAWDADKWKASADRPRPRWSPLIMQDVRNRLFRLIDATPNLDWLLLTKRPENIAKMIAPFVVDSENWFFDAEERKRRGLTHAGTHKSTTTICNHTRKNLWLGVSVENQQAADERIPILLRTPAAVRFLSCEPLLGPVDLAMAIEPTSQESCPHCGDDERRFLTPKEISETPVTAQGDALCMDCNHSRDFTSDGNQIDLLIVGGESGPKARPCKVEWIRSIVKQCKDAGVACFVKQVGSKPYEMAFDGPAVRSWGEAKVVVNGESVEINLKDKKGGEITEWPADLRVRQMPTGATA